MNDVAYLSKNRLMRQFFFSEPTNGEPLCMIAPGGSGALASAREAARAAGLEPVQVDFGRFSDYGELANLFKSLEPSKQVLILTDVDMLSSEDAAMLRSMIAPGGSLPSGVRGVVSAPTQIPPELTAIAGDPLIVRRAPVAPLGESARSPKAIRSGR